MPNRLFQIAVIAVVLAAAVTVVFAAPARVVQGKVVDASARPVAGAIVYMKDMKKLTVTSHVSVSDGSFRFGQLSADDDYEVWADLRGRKSATKTVSQFELKKVFDITLKLK